MKMIAGKLAINNRAFLAVLTLVGVAVSMMSFHEGRFIALSMIGIAGFYFIVYLIVRNTQALKVVVELQFRAAISLIVLTFVFLVFAGIYLSQYNFIPIWDYANYWNNTLGFNRSLQNGAVDTFRQVVYSVNYSDYNLLLSWIMSFPVYLFPSWKGAVFIESCIAAVPAALLMAGFIVSKSMGSSVSNGSSGVFVAAYAFSLFTPSFLAPIFLGYFDAVPAVLFIALLVALMDVNFPKRRFGAIFIGLGLCGVFLLRRWFIFGVIGMVLCCLIYWTGAIVVNASAGRIALFKLLCFRVATLAIVVALPLMSVFRPFVFRSAGGQYSQSYSAWTVYDSYPAKILNVVNRIGLLWFIVGLISVVILCIVYSRLSVLNKTDFCESIILPVSVFLGAVLSSVVLWHVQDFGEQHWYVILFFIEIFSSVPFFSCVNLLKNGDVRTVINLIVVALSVVSLLQGFSVVSVPSQISLLLGKQSVVRPIKQNDVTQKRELITYLRQQTVNGEAVYFAAASANLNYSLADTTLLPDVVGSAFPVIAADVDSRDGFNTEFFDARFVVTSTPVSLHMNEENERVVVALNSLVQDSSSFLGRHYVERRSFQFDGPVVVHVYERVSPIEAEDIMTLKDYFNRWYSDSPDLFANRFDGYVSNMKQDESVQ